MSGCFLPFGPSSQELDPLRCCSQLLSQCVTLGGVHKFCSMGLNGCGRCTVHRTGVTDKWPGGDFASCESFRIQAGASLNNLLGGFSSAQRPSDPLPPLRTERRWDLHTHTLHTRTHMHAHITATTKAATGNWPSPGLKSVGGAAKSGQVGSSRKGCFVGKLHGGEGRRGKDSIFGQDCLKILVFLLRGSF